MQMSFTTTNTSYGSHIDRYRGQPASTFYDMKRLVKLQHENAGIWGPCIWDRNIRHLKMETLDSKETATP